ncbi:phage virion morphogenesis protein [Enterobacter sp.]|uniref:phage virion morphogenesis protein n=1 Tax=Enterobacter sp. TaxID=42895 RepID=UPI0029700701|nr:phage virion morphogenesis protein [Enterobacter sp.]
MAEIKLVENWLEALLAQLEPAQRKKMMHRVAAGLRQQQQNNIRQQQNPDGSTFEPRKINGRAKQGRVKRQMFSKLRTARYLKSSATGNEAEVSFSGQVQRIARVHHYGLRDRVRKGGPVVRYARRELLGISEISEDLIQSLLIEHLSR